MKVPKRRFLLGLALILLGGLYVTDHLFLQRRHIASFAGRVAPSSVSYYDLSELSDAEFTKAFKYALVQGLQVVKDNGRVGVSFGMFQVKNESGAKVYACEKYPNLEITLQAEGVAYSGNVPTITVRGPCLASDDGKKIQPFMIPLKSLYTNLRNSTSYKVDIDTRGDSFTMSAQYLYNEWPQYWNVVSVKLSNSDDNVSMDGYELISLLDQPLTLDFAEDQ